MLYGNALIFSFIRNLIDNIYILKSNSVCIYDLLFCSDKIEIHNEDADMIRHLLINGIKAKCPSHILKLIDNLWYNSHKANGEINHVKELESLYCDLPMLDTTIHAGSIEQQSKVIHIGIPRYIHVLFPSLIESATLDKLSMYTKLKLRKFIIQSNLDISLGSVS